MSSARSSFLQGTRFFVVARLGAAALSFLWVMVLAAHLSGDETGLVLELFFLSQMLIFSSDLGLSQALIRCQTGETQMPLAIERIVSAVVQRCRRLAVVLPALFLMSALLTDATPSQIVCLLVSHAATAVYSTVNTGMLALRKRFAEAISEFVSRFLALFVGFIVLPFHPTASVGIGIYVVADVVQLTVVIFLLRKSCGRVRLSRSVQLDVPRDLKVKSAVAMASSSSFGAGDYWAMSWRGTSNDFATYALAMRVIDGASLVASSTGYSQVPDLIDSLRSGDKNKWNKLMKRVKLLNLSMTLGIFIFVIALAKIDSFAGRFDLGDVLLPVLVLVVSCPFLYFAKYLSFVLLAVDPKSSSKITIITGFLQVCIVTSAYAAGGLPGVFFAVAFINAVRYLLIQKWISSFLKKKKKRS